MERISDEQFQQKFASAQGQQSRLRTYAFNLKSDVHLINFDDKLYEVMTEYSWSKARLEEIRAYLNRITDEKGRRFARSYKDHVELEDAVKLFQRKEKDSFRWNRHYQRAVDKVMRRYAKAKLNPIRYACNEDIWEEIEDSHTSAGILRILDGINHKCDFPKDQIYLVYVEKTEEALKVGSYEQPALAGYRGQGGSEYTEEGEETGTFKAKTRLVWIMPLWNVLSEITFSHPLNKWLADYPWTAIAKDDPTINRDIAYYRSVNSGWVSLDYSKYDASIPSWLLESAFEVLAAAFKLDDYSSRLLEVLKNDFIHTNIVMGDGIEHVDHGDPSGSGLTAIINGICNEIMTETWASALEVKLGEYMIMGDDNLIFIRSGEVKIASIASYLDHNFGVLVNSDKSKQGSTREAPEFLSRWWTYDGPYRHPNILVSKMLYPERFRRYYGETGTTPELVFYSYILGYRAGMTKFFDVGRFLRDNHFEDRKYTLDRTALQSLPYNVRLHWKIA